MREILFRGKQIDNGEWVEGFYYKMSETTYCFAEDYERNPVPEHHYILQERMTDWGLPNQIIQIEVDPETICQFTGMCDVNGNKVYEGDIIKHCLSDAYAPIEYSCYQNCFGSGTAKHIGFYVAWSDNLCLRRDLGYWIGKGYTVAGNVFDNPELLQGETK